MVLLLPTNPSDPVTSIWCSHDNLLFGTASGSVRLFFRTSPEAELWNSVMLCKRAPEAIVGLSLNDRSEVFAVAGDACILRWDLTALEYDRPLIKGCRYDRVDFAMEHKWNHCPHTSTFFHATDGADARIIVIRANGECCVTNLNECKQQLMDGVGPLPEVYTKVHPYAFDGTRVVYVTKRYGGTVDLSLYKVWEGSQNLRTQLRIEAHQGPLKGIRFLNEDYLALLLNKSLYFWCTKSNRLARLIRGPKIEVFDLVLLPPETGTAVVPRILLISITPQGVINLGEVLDLEESSKAARYQNINPVRKQFMNARFHLDFPYCIKCSIRKGTLKPLIMYNDDSGIHVEEDLFVL